MVNKFALLRTPRIMFGWGQVERLRGQFVQGKKNLLVITGSSSFIHNPGLGKILLELEYDGHTVYIEKIEKEPSPGDIDRITDKFCQAGVDVVISIGGGSVMDSGKAVSAMLPLGGTVLDYLEGVGSMTHPGIKKLFIAIPTTAGTGSEATANAVLSLTGPDGFKRSLRNENLVPDMAIVDPELTVNCPPDITASSGMDAFTQLTESYLSLKSGPLTDSLALEGVRNIHSCLSRAVEAGDDRGARSGMSYAALLSGITLSNAGLGLIHGFASSAGGIFDIPHGVICGTLMGVVNRFNIESLLKADTLSVAHEKYSLLGKLLSGVDNRDRSWYMRFVADYIDELTEKLQIKRLGSFGITVSDLGRIADNTDHKANPVKFEKEELVEMLRRRL
jgi:alcohol dehydrogenase